MSLRIYLTKDVISDGVLNRTLIYTGWGVYNNLGVIIAMSIPFAFYFAARTKMAALWLSVSALLYGAVLLSCSRGSIVTATLIYILSFILTVRHVVKRWDFYLILGVFLVIIAAFAFRYSDGILKLFAKVPKIFEISDGKLVIMDNDRFRVYKDGFAAFLDAKIFGQTFFPGDYYVYDFADLDAFSSFFPPRWHNTAVQILASSGGVGALAYIYHRAESVRVYIKRRKDPSSRLFNTYVALSVGALLIASLLDCHLFNIGPTLHYSILLAVLEFSEDSELRLELKK